MKRKFTDQQETEIRRLFFKEGKSAKDIMEQFGVSKTGLGRIIGGPISRTGRWAPEKTYR